MSASQQRLLFGVLLLFCSFIVPVLPRWVVPSSFLFHELVDRSNERSFHERSCYLECHSMSHDCMSQYEVLYCYVIRWVLYELVMSSVPSYLPFHELSWDLYELYELSFLWVIMVLPHEWWMSRWWAVHEPFIVRAHRCCRIAHRFAARIRMPLPFIMPFIMVLYGGWAVCHNVIMS